MFPFVPAKAGTQGPQRKAGLKPWIPAFAGMNGVCSNLAEKFMDLGKGLGHLT